MPEMRSGGPGAKIYAGTALWVFTMQPHVGGTADDVGGILPIALPNFKKGIFYIGRTGLTAGSSYGVAVFLRENPSREGLDPKFLPSCRCGSGLEEDSIVNFRVMRPNA